jgi:mannan endo-1,4-beta-mannosidase
MSLIGINYKLSFCILLLLFLQCKKSPLKGIDTVPPGDGLPKLQQRTKTGILNYLEELKNRQLVLTGQQCGDGDDAPIFYENNVETLVKATGKYPGLVGVDYGWRDNNLGVINNVVINYWKKGGLVTISWHCDNPFIEGNYQVRWKSVEDKASINFPALLQSAPGSKAKDNYRKELDKVGKALQELKKAGVVVLWRPFHEMNGNWFWWGIDAYNNQQKNTEAFKALWKDMYETFTNSYGLNNLVWCYSPYKTDSWNASSEAYYPGSAYVDIAGLDFYGRQPLAIEKDYGLLSMLNKNFALCEVGDEIDSGRIIDEVKLVAELKGKASYFVQWHSWPGNKMAIVDNLNAREMMQSATAITLDEINP